MDNIIVFNTVRVSVTDAERDEIFAWCSDNVEEFGAVPQDFVLDMDTDAERTLSYDEMLSALTPEQLTALNTTFRHAEEVQSAPL